MLGVPEQALLVLHEAIEPVLAHGALVDKGRALLLAARCQMAVAGFRPNRQGQTGDTLRLPHRPNMRVALQPHTQWLLKAL